MGAKKISGIGLDQWKNLVIKIVMQANKGETIKHTKKCYIKPTFGSVYLKRIKYDNDKMMQIDFW